MENNKKQMWLTCVLFAVYMLVLVWIILFKMQLSVYDLTEIRNLNLIPFGEMLVLNGKPDFGEVFKNCLIFVPMGLYLSMLNKGNSKVTSVLFIAAVSCCLELLQYIFAIGASDITDFLANTVGGILGMLLYCLFGKVLKEKTCLVLNVFALICTVAFIVLFVLILAANI